MRSRGPTRTTRPGTPRSGVTRPGVLTKPRSAAAGRGKRSRPTRRLEKGEATANRIVDVAEEIFAAKGYEGTTLREVAVAAGLREPSIYNHFASKDELYGIVLERAYRPLAARLEEVLRQASPPEVLMQMAEATAQIFAERPSFARLYVLEVVLGGRHLPPLFRDWTRSLQQQGVSALHELFPHRETDVESMFLRILAATNVIVGYAAGGALYNLLGGSDHLSERVQRKQRRILRTIIAALEDDATR